MLITSINNRNAQTEHKGEVRMSYAETIARTAPLYDRVKRVIPPMEWPVDADVIVLAGVHFMAETAKLLNPAKTVLIPDLRAGCSLAESITAADVRLLRERYPGVPVVTYVNTSAAVKAESDICCTSGNALKIVESLGVDTVIMLPDEYLARNIAAKTRVKVLTWSGHCIVHERFTAAEVRALRED